MSGCALSGTCVVFWTLERSAASLHSCVFLSVWHPQTGEDAALDTEQQMAAAKQQIEEDLDADAELLGLKRKKKPAAAAGEASAGTAEVASADAGGDAAAPAATAGGGDAAMAESEQHDELVRSRWLAWWRSR